jgi:hypothetical protein
VREDFNLQLKKRFQLLQTEDNTLEESWQDMKEVYHQTAKERLGYSKKGDKEWLSENTWQAIKERKECKAKIMGCRSERIKNIQKDKYREANIKVKKSARKDKRRYIDGLAQQAEDAARQGNQSTLYKITRNLCNNKRTSSLPIKDKNGKMLTSKSDQEARWREHFEEVLNRPEPLTPASVEEPSENLKVNIEPPTIDEIKEAIKHLKNGKAPGPDNLNAELFKADPDTAAEALHPLFDSIWKEEKIPSDWQNGSIVKVPKKGNLADCNNWRGITLLSIPSKIFAKIMIRRLEPALDKILRKEQAGFRRGRGCSDHICALRNIIEQCTEWQRELYVNFIDYEKAFDSVHRETLWKILRSYGVPTKIINVIKQFYINFRCTIGTSELNFAVKSGVRQGCVMSGMLFIIVIDWVMTKATADGRRGIRWTPFTQLDDLDYADDISLLSHNADHIQQKTDRLAEYGEQVGLRINIKKTKLMKIGTERRDSITVRGEPVDDVERFCYLGSVVTREGGTEADIKARLGKARQAFGRLTPIWKSSKYSRRTKIKIYSSCVLSVLLYGSECWRTTQRDNQQLAVFHTTCLRKIYKIYWPNTISNADLYKLAKQEPLVTTIRRRRWRWVGHTLRRERDNITRTALRWTPEGRRRRGRPKNTWRRTLEAEAQTQKKTWSDLETIAKNRRAWSDLTAALCASNGHEADE